MNAERVEMRVSRGRKARGVETKLTVVESVLWLALALPKRFRKGVDVFPVLEDVHFLFRERELRGRVVRGKDGGRVARAGGREQRG